MKALFLFFLLLNAAYFYYQNEGQDDAAAPTILKQPALPAGVDSLVLLRERGLGIVAEPTQAAVIPEATPNAAAASLKPTVATRKASTKPETVSADHVANVGARSTDISSKSVKNKLPVAPEKSAEAACFTLGPFAQASAASRAADAISALGVSVTRRQESQRTPKGYWVYLPAAKSYQAAKRMVAELQKKGLTDLYIMGKGSRENAISLGLFNNKTTAEERFQQVNKLGLKAVFETQYRVSKQAWLDMSVAGNQTATVATLTEMAEGFPNASLTQRKCQ